MESPAFWSVVMRRGDGVLIPAVEDLTRDELRSQPAGPATNPIGWLVWHSAKVQDDYIALIGGSKTVWDEQGWNARFPNAEHALHVEPKQVGEFDPVDAATLLGYYNAVRVRAKAILDALSPEDFDRVLEPIYPGGRAMPLSDVLAMVASDNIQHIGQIAYLRGMLREQGWYQNRRALA